MNEVNRMKKDKWKRLRLSVNLDAGRIYIDGQEAPEEIKKLLWEYLICNKRI
jgi:hypothetical protein